MARKAFGVVPASGKVVSPDHGLLCSEHQRELYVEHVVSTKNLFRYMVSAMLCPTGVGLKYGIVTISEGRRNDDHVRCIQASIGWSSALSNLQDQDHVVQYPR